MNFPSLKRVLSVALAALAIAGTVVGCGGEKKAQTPESPSAGQTVKINFPTASASGALYAVGAAITNMWNQNIPGVSAASQASAGGIANLGMVADGEAQVSIAISSNCFQALNGIDSFQHGSIDGAWIRSGAPASAVSQALSSGCQLLNIDDGLMNALKAKYPWYASYTIPQGTYPNQDADIHTSAIKMVMFTRADMPETLVYQLTKAFWEHIDELGQSQKNLKGLKPADAVKDIANLPLHPGAEKYYKEIGVLK